MRGLRDRVPAPLRVLLALCVIEALAWSVVLPPLQGPDEVSHVAYVQKIGEARVIPWTRANVTDPRAYSTQLADAIIVGGVTPVDANPSGRPLGTAVDEQIWDEREAGFDRAQRADGGFTSALRNPPAYYLYAAIPYLATSSLGIFDQVFFMRLANIPLLLATVLFVWLIAGELLGRRRWLQTLATGAVALQPLLTHLAAVVNPDVMLAATWSAALYLMIVILKRGVTARRAAALVALCALSGLTHGRGAALVAPAVLTLALAVWQARRPGARPTRRAALATVGLAATLGAGAFVYIALSGAVTFAGLRWLASYLVQFYLPHPRFLTAIGPDYGFREVAVERFFGAYVQLEVNFSTGVYDALWAGLIAIALSAGVALLLRPEALRRRWDIASVLVVAPLGTLGLLHATAFPIVSGPVADPVITGRYLLPLVSLYGIAIALAVSWLPRRWGVAAGGALLAALALLQLGALGITIERFYA